MSDSLLHFVLDVGYNFIAAILSVLSADVGRDGESRRYGHSQKVHFRKVCALAAKEISHPGITFGLTIAERINSFCHNYYILIQIFYLLNFSGLTARKPYRLKCLFLGFST